MTKNEAADYLSACADGYDPVFDEAVEMAVAALRYQDDRGNCTMMELKCGSCRHFIGGGDWGLCCQIDYGLHYEDSEACQDYEQMEELNAEGNH